MGRDRSEVIKHTVIIIEAAERQRGERKKGTGVEISYCVITIRNTSVQHKTIHYITAPYYTCPFHRCSGRILAILISVYRIGKT
jgi:hypothetical protein